MLIKITGVVTKETFKTSAPLKITNLMAHLYTLNVGNTFSATSLPRLVLPAFFFLSIRAINAFCLFQR